MTENLKTNIIEIMNNVDLDIKQKYNALSTIRYEHIYLLSLPYGPYFLPITNNKKPFAEDFTKLVIEIYPLMNDKYSNAVFGELLWKYKHDLHFAESSVNSYYSILNYTNLISKYHCTQIILSICRIYSTVKINGFQFAPFFDETLCKHKNMVLENNFCSLFILRGLLSCTENYVIDSITLLRSNKQYRKARAYSDVYLYLLQEKKFKHSKMSVSEINQGIAKDYEEEANLFNWDDSQDALE